MTMTFQQTDTTQVCALSNYCSSVGGTIEAGRQASVGGTAGSTEQTFSCAASQADDNEFSFECIVPAGSTWGSGDWTINVNFSTGNMDATWASCFICRVNSSCVNQATIGSATGLGISTSAGAQSTVISGAAQTPSAGDKVIITLGFSNSNTMVARTVGITPSLTIVAAGFEAPAAAATAAYYTQYYRDVVLA